MTFPSIDRSSIAISFVGLSRVSRILSDQKCTWNPYKGILRVVMTSYLFRFFQVLPHFPVVTSLSSALEKRIDKIRKEEKDKRPDLFALAMGYSGLLKASKHSLIPEHMYHNKPPSKTTTSSPAPAPPGMIRSSDLHLLIFIF